jgi:autotransporter-associated beta strand protein
LNIFDGGGLGVGTYPLVGYGSLSGGTTGFGAVNLPSRIAAYSLTTNGNAIDLVISATKNVTSQWQIDGSGAWIAPSNWSGDSAPGVAQDSAVFGAALSGGTAAVSLGQSCSLASLGFSTTNGASYAIAASGGAALTLANSAGAATISNSGGNHTIAAPLVLGGNLIVSATAGIALTIADGIGQSGGSCSLNVRGGGVLVLGGADAYTGGTTVSGGTLDVAAASALPESGLLTINGGGRLVLGSAAGIAALLDASSPIGAGAPALSAAASAPATIAAMGNEVESAATIVGGAPASSPSAGGGKAAAAPEPGTLALLAVGLTALAGAAWRKRNARRATCVDAR